jgi:ribose 5-phosphate isomerase A
MTAAQPPSQAIAGQAVALVKDGMTVGLGTGRAATAFIEALAANVRKGLRVRGIPTSEASGELARRLGVPLVTLDDVDSLDMTVDGADEVDPQGNLIKGYGGALVREKIVAAASRMLVILVGEEKLVPVLGSRGKLPVEVLPFGRRATEGHLRSLGLDPQLRMSGQRPFATDSGNQILDCGTGSIQRPAELEAKLLAIPGVVGTGLFLGMTDQVLVQRGSQVEVQKYSGQSSKTATVRR